MQSIMSRDELWDVRTWHNYMAWFNREGMRTVWWRGSTTANIHNRPPSPFGSRLHLSFSMNSEIVQQMINYYLPFYFVSSFMI
jgi:light-regulated signal transduction histidine kinase (bacteriophytochrome)